MRHHISTILCAALLALAPLTARADDCTDFKALSGSWADLHEVLEKGMDAELTDEQADELMKTVAELADLTVAAAERLLADEALAPDAQNVLESVAALDEVEEDQQFVDGVAKIAESLATLQVEVCK
ncbi:MAG: hypothetical protein CO108_08260 [Deltaproteobacteria bacterium CG_4_9_14_3_um_filter_63_12]|nr:MAG: hypothetical protein COW42_13045 [Deltaproteobacteria bacterium CG17_big_fil_post_rev_8_21_14_2_50_63_7]PJB44806.1 MAG: hypothetical protein CO108_08260 [Deltaproteobacteria bacterium CG_4_9_14_3_um_filter_63_12]